MEVGSSFPKVEEIATGIENNQKSGNEMSSINSESGLQINCFSQLVDDAVFNIQIIRLQRQIYAWVGLNSAKFGHLYAAAPTRPSNQVSVTSLIGGSSDNTGSGIARRLALKTGLNVVLACNIPKNSPMLEANAEKILVQKLIKLGYAKTKSGGSSSKSRAKKDYPDGIISELTN